MLIRRLLVGLLLALGAWTPPTLTDRGRGEQAYSDLIARYWDGPAVGGNPHLFAFGTTTTYCPGCLWGAAMLSNASYAYWKATGNTAARNRISSHWQFVKGYYTPGLAICGAVTNSVARASDDAHWTAAFYLQAYEASGDAGALAAAKAMLDCTHDRWSDSGTAGCVATGAAVGAGIFYDDTCAAKGMYQGVYALAMYWYYQLSGDATYRTRAIALDSWLAATMYRGGQIVQGQQLTDDGLYWATLNPDGTIPGLADPYHILPGSSATVMSGDMAETVLAARLYADTGDAAYLARVQKTARGMKTYYRVAGVITSMRDARTDGWAAYLYMNDVVYAGLAPSDGLDAADYLTTLRAVRGLGRNSDLTYAGCWGGPSSNASCLWSATNGNTSQQLDISANAVMWPISALRTIP